MRSKYPAIVGHTTLEYPTNLSFIIEHPVEVLYYIIKTKR